MLKTGKPIELVPIKSLEKSLLLSNTAPEHDPLAVIQKDAVVLVLFHFMKQSHWRRPDYDLIPI